MKKGTLIFGGLTVIVLGLSYLEFTKTKQERVDIVKESRVVPWHLADLSRVRISNGEVESEYSRDSNNKDHWWLDKPFKYPAHPSNFLLNYEMMTRVLADETFAESSDAYGFGMPMGKIDLTHTDGRKMGLTVGGTPAPGDKLYIHSSENDSVYVVHKAWAQLLIQPRSVLINDRVELGISPVRQVRMVESKNEKWKMEKDGKGTWGLSSLGKKIKLTPENVFQVWKGLKDVQLNDHKVGPPPSFSIFQNIFFINEDGHELKISLNEKLDKIYLHHYKAQANVEPLKIQALFESIREVLDK